MSRSMKEGIIALLALTSLLGAANSLHAQGTAFTYQGRLQDGTNHATGTYDFTFTIWTNASGPSQVGNTVTNIATGVSNGLFTATMDFGGGVFDGNPRWLEIGVRTNGGGVFTTLSPRQALTAAPYAIHAGSVNAAGINGTIPAASIGSGTITSNMLAPGVAAASLAHSDAVLFSDKPNATNLIAAGYTRANSLLDLGGWQSRSTSSAPVPRSSHTAIWTGAKMIVWGGVNSSANPLNTGGSFDPTSDVWLSVTASNAPSARSGHTAIWTGSQMIIWGGGTSGGFSSDGSRYSPTTDSWSPVTTANAPSARSGHTATWTGSEMIIWGGHGSGGPSGTLFLNTGARYNPATDVWLPISSDGAPAARDSHTAIWTGNEMIVWGGLNVGGAFPSYVATNYADGFRYNPTTDTWLPLSTNGAPAARHSHAAVWTSSEMIVWGGANVVFNSGFSSYTYFNNGARYNPTADSWLPLSTDSAPSARYQAPALPAVWSGTEMIVWGGGTTSASFGDGGRYNPTSDSWLNVTPTDSRYQHTMVWTGSEMLVFGGYQVPSGSYSGELAAYALPRVIYLYLKP